uniref:Uncharacterized protein n=1 Tax=Arundo donax TaxID=35708 RepID=A0A0A9U2Q4_ARUDO
MIKYKRMTLKFSSENSSQIHLQADPEGSLKVIAFCNLDNLGCDEQILPLDKT